ncbi:unnamed protein product, partial [Brassica oleracea]
TLSIILLLKQNKLRLLRLVIGLCDLLQVGPKLSSL